MDTDQLANDVVVNSKRKTFGQGTMISVNDFVNPREKEQRINVREETVQEIRTNTALTTFVKLKALDQILLGLDLQPAPGS